MIVLDFIKDFKRTSTMVVVDPVMGDHGKLYSTMDRAMVYKMRDLIKKADIITPNLTEALYLLGEEDWKDISEEKIKDMLIQLASYGPKIVIITSAPDDLSTESINVFAYDREEDEFFKLTSQRIPIDFPGTGDTFTSVLIGELLNGRDLYKAVKTAMDFVFLAIEESIKFSYPSREGILLEKVLWRLNA